MKRFVLILLSIFTCAIACAEQITINWLNTDGTTNQTTSCTIGGDVILPYTPTKYGYTFQGWTTNYIPIEYLEATGTQYIDTGVVANGEFVVKYMVYFNSLPNTAAGIFVGGARSSNQHLNFGQFTGVVTIAYLNEYWDINHSINTKLNNEIEIVYKNGLQHISINDVKYGDRFITGTEELNMNIYLFKRNHFNPQINEDSINGRIYYFKIWKNDVLVRDFIPVLDSSGIPCLFDRVGGEFYYNAGTGQFIAGPIINE